MGTFFTITAAITDPQLSPTAVEKILDAALAEVDRVEQLMTTWKPDSPLSNVNAQAGRGAVSAPLELIDLVERARGLSELTGGKFDITFGALGGLWKFRQDDFAAPTPHAIATRLPLVDYQGVRIDREAQTIELAKPGMRIGLGAIAKGYGVDRAGKVLVDNGIENFIVYGGGDLLIFGQKGSKPWTVGIQDPRDRSRYFARFKLRENRAVVTSGDYEKFVVKNGKRYHHILDPDTGRPARRAASVTVIAKSATDADALATGIFVLGLPKGLQLIEEDPALEGIIVDRQLKVHVSSGLKSQIQLTPISRPQGEGAQ